MVYCELHFEHYPWSFFFFYFGVGMTGISFVIVLISVQNKPLRNNKFCIGKVYHPRVEIHERTSAH